MTRRSSRRQRLVLIGWGAIGQTVAEMLRETPIDIVGVGVQTQRPLPGLPPAAVVITEPDELTGLEPDVVAEAAGRESVAPWGRSALEAGADFIVSSASAFADPELLTGFRHLAKRSDAQVLVQTGALGGIDALAAAALMGLDSVEHRIVKPPTAWANTPAETLCALGDLTEPAAFYVGSASETAAMFPKNANVAMTTALAGIGPAATRITLVADPRATTNRHEIRATGAFGELSVSIANNPLPANPKTSAMAALSLVRAIQNRVSALVV